MPFCAEVMSVKSEIGSSCPVRIIDRHYYKDFTWNVYLLCNLRYNILVTSRPNYCHNIWSGLWRCLGSFNWFKTQQLVCWWGPVVNSVFVEHYGFRFLPMPNLRFWSFSLKPYAAWEWYLRDRFLHHESPWLLKVHWKGFMVATPNWSKVVMHQREGFIWGVAASVEVCLYLPFGGFWSAIQMRF